MTPLQVTTSNHIISPGNLTDPLHIPGLNDTSRPFEVEIGCGNGRFLAARAAAEPETIFLGIERMLGRVRRLERKAIRHKLNNLFILRLEALYTFYYLLPAQSVTTLHVLFPDPWPKRRHWGNRLFEPIFLDALCLRLKSGGTIQVATDHHDYFQKITARFDSDPRFAPATIRERNALEQTDFEMRFRSQGLPIYQCAYSNQCTTPPTLPPLELPPESLPRAERNPTAEPPHEP